MSALYFLPGANNFQVQGQANGTLTTMAPNVSINIQLQPLTFLAVQVLRPDGLTPALNTTVSVGGKSQDTGTNGRVIFSNLQVPGSYSILAVSQSGGDTFDGARTNVTLSSRGTNAPVTLILPGVGAVTGTVVGSDGTTPANNAQVTLEIQSDLFSGNKLAFITDSQGRFAFAGVPLGPFLVTASSASLAASENDTLALAGHTNIVSLRLGASGSILGLVVRADGITPVEGVDLVLDYTPQSSNPGKAVFHTGADGAFRFDHIPAGSITVSSADPDFDGIIDFTTALSTNGQVLNLGKVPFDELLPQVVSVTPADATLEVPITNAVVLAFNKPLDTNTVNTGGIFIRGTNGVVASRLTILADTNGAWSIVRLQPVAPLRSKGVYSVFVLSGDLFGATGATVGSGPRDLVGRILPATFVSSFATADNTPPQLVSLFPSNNAVQIDPSAVPRLSFDKTLNPAKFFFALFGPSGPVAGTASVGINGQVLSFLPTANLLANASYTLVVSNVLDLAGNRAAGEPFVSTFATLDTIGPVISSLLLASNVPPAGGATVPVVATLATNEAGASVRFTQDFNPVGTATNPPYQVLVQLPRSGSTTIRAIATDQYGNDGQFVQLVVAVQVPQPPTIQFSLLSPTNGPVPSGSPVVVGVTATGDTAISNLTALISGAATGVLVSTNGSSLIVQGVVSNTAVVGQQIQVLARAIDNLGLSSGQRIFDVLISDGTPPTVAILSPANYSHLPTAPSFALTAVCSDNSSNVTLNLVISGSLSSTQTVALALTPNVSSTRVFTVPLSGAPTNGGAITALLTATDSATNVTAFTNTYWLPGTLGPSIATLTIGSNLPPLAGSVVPIDASIPGTAPGVSVRFLQATKLIGTVTNAPYELLVKLPQSGSTTIGAIATDPFGNDGVLAQLVITVQTNTPPSVRFVRVSPASGPAPSGSAFLVDVVASGNSNLFHITASLSGAATGSFAADGTTLHLQGSVLPTATASQQIQITAQAVDGLGQSSGPQSFSLPVSDGTPPALVILSPPENEQLVPGQPFDLAVLVSDNSSSVTLGLSVTGSVSTTQSLPLALVPNVPTTNVFVISLPNEPTNGSPVVAMLTAMDGAGNTTLFSRVFWLPGTRTTVVWERQALGQTFNCTNGPGSYTWPNNNNWSQSVVFGVPCGIGTNLEVAPSNWSTTNYPDGTNLDVILGSVGGAPANLDVSVALHSLTIQSDGGLTMAAGSSLTAFNYQFQGDGGITRIGLPQGLVLSGGTMSKTAGTNAFTIDPGIPLNSSAGTFAVDSGTLVLPGASYYTNGTFNVAANASLVLLPAGQSTTLAGTLNGSGQGSLRFEAGTTLNPGTGGVNFDFPDPLLTWLGGAMNGGNPITNSGAMTLSGASDLVLNRTAQFKNAGLWRNASTGQLNVKQSARFENLLSGIYDLQTDGGLFSDDYAPWNFDNYGIFRKSGGTNISTISISFNNQNGSIEVDSGTLALANNGSSSNGTFSVGAGAALDLTGGQTPTWAGVIQGTGGGHVELKSGTLIASPSLILDFPATFFQWNGGIISGTVSNANVLNLPGATDVRLERSSLFNNGGLVRADAGRLNLRQSARFENLLSGTYDLQSDAGLFSDDYAPWNFDNYGIFRKSGGTNISTISISFNNQNGSIEVDSGTLALANNGSSSNGTFTVALGAALDLTGGQSPTWAGLMNGQGPGTVMLGSGTFNAAPNVRLNFTNGMFQWTGGALVGVATNLNVISVSGSNSSVMQRGSRMYNLNLVRHDGTGGLNLKQSARFENLATGTYDLEANSGLFTDDYGPQYFENFGTLRKRGGTGNSAISAILFNNLGGVVDVESGTLALANNGASSNGTFTVAGGAALDLTGGQSPTWAGLMNGQGAGTVVLNSGTLNANPSVMLNFTNGLFQWTGGTLVGVATNLNVITISGGNPSVMQRSSQIYNLNLVRHNGTGPLNLKQSARFENLATGTYDLESDSGLLSDDYGPQYFDNFGTLRKSGGGGNSAVSAILFNNLGGVVDVASGTLALANNGSSSNGTFKVAAGAVLDLTGGQSPTWTGLMDGQGAGTVLFSSGTLNANPAVMLNFTNGLFQWTGGSLVGVVTNLNVIAISGSTTVMQKGSQFYNLNLVRHNGSAGLNLKQSAHFENLAAGTFDLESDSGVFTDDYAPQYFDNLGTLRKSGGTNTSVISISFNNQNGSIEVDRGTLSLAGGNYVQGTGALTIGLGGTNSGQSGSLAISANALLGGPLNVFLTNGYSPAVGDQFQILSCVSLSGNFSSVQVPAGFVLTNIGSSVLVRFTGGGPQVVLGRTPGRVSLPTPDLLLFTSASNSTWQVWSATNLGLPNWLPLGSVYVTNSFQVWRDPNALPAPQRFYRVLRSPQR